ncbi:MAG: LysE family translocator [Thermoleophilaceae bacterium]
MPEPSTILLFALAATALIVIPGPAVLYIVGQSVGQGRRAGVVSAMGVASGGLVHVVGATIGLSGLLLSSATLFSVVKYAGAAYLLYLGTRRLLGRDAGILTAPSETRSRRTIYRDGAVVNILNPKTALFFYAFLPQFIDPARGSVALQSLLLGALFVAMALVSDSLWALAAGSAAQWLRGRPRAIRAERWVSGGIFVGLGAFTALAGAHRAAK